MQIGGKRNETGWGVYQACLDAGGIIATGHEHSYSRTYLMSDFENQTVVHKNNHLEIDEGQSFAFVSGLGGRGIRDQERTGDWWAAEYSSTQNADYGALFCTFGESQGECYFKDISGAVPDSFTIESQLGTTGSPTLTSPKPDTPLSGSSATLEWSPNGANITDWWLYVGSSPGALNYHNSGSLLASDLDQLVTGLPTDGSQLYATLWFKRSGDDSWYSTEQMFTATGSRPSLDDPTPGNELFGSTQTFSWLDNGAQATNFWLYIGSDVGLNDYDNSGDLGSALKWTATQLPNDGVSPVYVRLWYRNLQGTWLYIDERYTAGSNGAITPVLSSHVTGDTLAGATDTFSWSANGSGATNYWVSVGSVQGGTQYYSKSVGMAESVTIETLPTNGGTVWMRLWYRSDLSDSWQFIDHSLKASGVGPQITSHATNGALASPVDTISWTDSTGEITQWWLYIGSSVGGLDYEDSKNLGQAESYTTKNNNLPTGSVPVYVRLWYKSESGSWQYIDEQYSSAP